jgi:hypothetical protein
VPHFYLGRYSWLLSEYCPSEKRREGERERQRETQRERERETERQRDRERDRDREGGICYSILEFLAQEGMVGKEWAESLLQLDSRVQITFLLE